MCHLAQRDIMGESRVFINAACVFAKDGFLGKKVFLYLISKNKKDSTPCMFEFIIVRL